MGLGIGLTTNVYSSKWAMLFRELPAAATAKQLVMFQESADGDLAPVSYYLRSSSIGRRRACSLGVAAFETGIPFNVTFQGDLSAKPERVFGQLVSPDYFSVLGVKPQRGRVLSAAVDKSGDAPVVVISDRFWRNRLNSSPNTLGQILRLNGQIATIVGITPKNFNGALAVNPSELFVPITAPAALAPELSNDVLHQRNAKEFLALLCLAPGSRLNPRKQVLTLSHVISTSRILHRQRALTKAGASRYFQAGTSVPIPRKLKPALIGFFVALMGLVITLACMNLANMLIARWCANRRKELAIRLAVGASRFRLVRQMMSEGILLSLLGGGSRIHTSVWSRGVELSLHPAHDGAGRNQFQPGLARRSLRVRACDCLRHRIQPRARPASDESRPDPGTQRGLGAPVAWLQAHWSPQFADGSPGCSIAHAAADDRIPRNGN